MFRLSLVALLVAAAVARAGAPGPPPSTAAKVLGSGTAIVGKVTGIEADALEVLPYPTAKAKVKMNVATVKIETALLGAKNLTVVKVLMEANPVPPRPGRGGPVTLADGQQGLFFLQPHPCGTGFATQHAPIPPDAKPFDDDLATVKRIAKIVNEPLVALKEGNADDRLSAAVTLVGWYRQRPILGPRREEAIPAAETKAILKALLDADWTVGKAVLPGEPPRLSPRHLLGYIDLYPGTPGGLPAVTETPGEDLNAKTFEAFKAWHAKHADTFAIKRLVPKND